MNTMRYARMVVLLSIAYLQFTGTVCAGNAIIGSVSIRNAAGQNVYAERLAVFLVKSKNPVSADACRQVTDQQRKLDCLNNRHLDFYKRFQEKRHDSTYLIDQTDTSATGNFAFFNVPPGAYYVLVKFPSMIDGHKVAWQEPVTVSPAHIKVVTLNDDNLVLPKNRRR